MALHLAAVAVLLAGAALPLALSRWPSVALATGTGAGLLGSALGLASAVSALVQGGAGTISLPWSAPLAELTVGLDPLSAFFEVALFGLALPAVAFGGTYLRPHLGRRGLPTFLCFQNVLLAAMALVFSARQAVLFLVAWEVMAVASFLLVTFEHEREEVRSAGFVYLAASHLGTAFLFALFILLARGAGSFGFDAYAAARAAPAVPAALLFALALVGFGSKAGLVPLHVWLPEAHPAAPSHVSALLSGVMTKAGLYGIFRTLSWLPPAPAWHGLLLAGIGAAGAVAAITLALGARDIKRALAYSSVENVGIIALAAGTGVAASARGATAVAALAWAGALLHVWNHAAMKGLGFLGAGAVAHAAHGRDLEGMGGLLSRLPRTAGLLLVGLAALSALPPLGSFASEWLLYGALLRSGVDATGGTALLAWLALAALAFAGGVAAIAFTRIGGLALLGEPRGPGATAAREPSAGLWAPMAVLAAACVLLGSFPAAALRLASGAIAQASGLSPSLLSAELSPVLSALSGPMRWVLAMLVVGGIVLALHSRRRRALQGSAISGTWACGYARPTARMQYTARSFAQLFLEALAPRALSPRGRITPPRGLFPPSASARFEERDPARTHLFDPLFRIVAVRAARLRRYQADRLNLQLLYTVATLLALILALALRS